MAAPARAAGAALAATVALLAAAPLPARALTLAEGLAAVGRASRDAAVGEAEEQVLRSAERLAAAPRRPTLDAYTRETLLAWQPAALAGQQALPLSETASLAFGLRARQLLYDFGRSAAAERAAGFDAEAKRVETALARNRAALRFVQAYVSLLRADQLLALQRQEVTRFAAHRDDARALLEEGAVTENDLLQSEVRLADAVQRRLQAENQRALAAAQVNTQLARPLADPVEPEEPSAPAAAAPRLEEAVALALAQRLELARLRSLGAAVEARRDGVRAEYLPQLYVAGAYEYAQNKYQEHEGNWSLLAGVDVNLYAGGVSGERLRQRASELALLARLREQALDAIRLEVNDAFLALQTARSRGDASAKAVEQAQEHLRLERLRYAEGVGTASEVLDAVSLATSAEQNALNARYDVIDALARLDFAVGRDLVESWGAARPAQEGALR